MQYQPKVFSSNTAISGFSLLVAGFPMGKIKDKIYTNSMTPDCWIIEYVIKGKGFLKMPPFDYHPSAGNLYILPKQGQEYSYTGDPADPWDKACILLDGPLVERLIEAYGLKGKLFFENCEDVLEIFNEIFNLKNTIEESQYKALALVNTLFCSLRGRSVGGTVRQKDNTDVTAQLRTYIEDGCESDISIDKFCKSLRINKSNIIRTFRRRYGTAPYAYLMSCRLEHAKALLRFSSMRIKEIASRLQFADQYHFSAYFKKKIAISPAAYRKSA